MTLIDFGKMFLEELRANQTEFKANEIIGRINKMVWTKTGSSLSSEDKQKIITTMREGVTNQQLLSLIELINAGVK